MYTIEQGSQDLVGDIWTMKDDWQNVVVLGMSFTNMRNNKGPRIRPCGTPDLHGGHLRSFPLLTIMQAIGQVCLKPFPQRSSDTMGPQLQKQFWVGNGIECLPKVEKHNVTWLLSFNRVYNERKEESNWDRQERFFRKPDCCFEMKGRMKCIFCIWYIPSIWLIPRFFFT